MKRTATIAAIVVFVLGAATAVYLVAFREHPFPKPRLVPPTAAPAASTAAAAHVDAPTTFAIQSVSGSVEVRRGDPWVAVKAGDTIAAAEAIRTGDGAQAVIRDARGDELTLRERVELGVTTLSQTVTELTLTRGKVKAAAGQSTEEFRIQAGGAQTVAPSSSRFTVYADDRGAVAVASEKGDVKVISGGRAVTVATHQQTTVEPGAAPANPVAISDDVFLSVAWPEGEVHATHIPVRGKTEPGAIVRVNGHEVAVQSDGTFLSDVPLQDGKNPIAIQTESIGGGTKEDQRSVPARTSVPLDVDPSHLYDPPKAHP